MAEQVDSYAAIKLRHLDEQSSYRVYGRAVDFDLGDASRRWKPVFPCLCVHDSPDNPCPCPPWIWWLRSDMILAEGGAGHKDHEGNELRYFDVAVESKIVVESMQTVSAGALKSLGGNLSPSAVAGVADAEGGGTGSTTIAALPAGLVAWGLGVLGGVMGNMIWEAMKGLDGSDWDDLTPEQQESICKKWPWLCGK